MRKSAFVGLLLLAASCRHSASEEPASTAPRPSAAVGATARGALDAFMAAVNAQDLQALSLAWGDRNGPVRDSKTMSRQEMEKREVYLMRCFKHDSFRVVSESPAADAERQLQVEITRGTNKRTTDFMVAKGDSRWYVRSASIEPVTQFCSTK